MSSDRREDRDDRNGRDDPPRRRRDYDDRPPPKRGNKTLVVVLGILGGVVLVCGGLIFGLTLAVQRVRDAAARMSSTTNYHQIGVATHNYNDTYETIPAPYARNQREGEPSIEMGKRLSWRMEVLPYIEQGALYNQFNLSKAWDDPANRPFADTVVKTYGDQLDPLDPLDPLTRVRCFYDNGAVFNSDFTRKSSLAAVKDSSSSTILFVESADRVPWAQCNEFRFDPAGPLPPLGHPQRDVILVCMADGSVRAVKKSISPEVFKAAVHASDGPPGPEFDK